MTGTDVITNRARFILADTVTGATQRWSDAILLVWLNDGGRLIATLRPDSTLTAAWTLTDWADLAAIGNTVPLADKYREPLVDYVVARALAQDSQDKRDLARATEHFKQFIIKAGLPAHLSISLGRN
jgi:hypothetical protein